MKITIPPSPAIIPSASKLVNIPSGKEALTHSLNDAKDSSIKSMGTLDQSYIA